MYKKGDIIQDRSGNKAVVISITKDTIIYLYRNSTDSAPLKWALDNTTLVKVANTTIARKLYPHYREDGEWLIKTTL